MFLKPSQEPSAIEKSFFGEGCRDVAEGLEVQSKALELCIEADHVTETRLFEFHHFHGPPILSEFGGSSKSRVPPTQPYASNLLTG